MPWPVPIARRSLQLPHSIGPCLDGNNHKSPPPPIHELRVSFPSLEKNSTVCFCSSWLCSPEPHNALRNVTSTTNWAPLKQRRSCAKTSMPLIVCADAEIHVPQERIVLHPGTRFAAVGVARFRTRPDRVHAARCRPCASRGSWHPLQKADQSAFANALRPLPEGRRSPELPTVASRLARESLSSEALAPRATRAMMVSTKNPCGPTLMMHHAIRPSDGFLQTCGPHLV